MFEYKLIEGVVEGKFNEKVNKYLSEGWELYSGPTIHFKEGMGMYRFQALIREKEVKKEPSVDSVYQCVCGMKTWGFKTPVEKCDKCGRTKWFLQVPDEK